LKSAAAAGVAFLPAASFAAVGESPRFSVFGLVGDGTSLSEGAAYGTDQKSPLYSPYSVYGEASDKSLYKPGSKEFTDKAKKVLAESKKRLTKLPSYVDKKAWWEVSAELDRYMYETRGAVRSLAKTPAQKKAATEFFKTIEKADISARLKKQAECAAASKESVAKLDAFVALL
jgi:photosystem II oxygen-evolving enhancer protein 3